MADKPYLLSDDEIISFIIHGSHIVEADFPDGFNESIYEELEALDIPRNNPGDGILDKVPKLYQVYDHPKVRGALVSLLGEDMQMNGHRHCHVNPPGTRSQAWHQDGTNKRHHHIQTVLAMYYPQDVSAELGPTVIMPGTHFRNAPTDRMATYANFREQVPLTVKAGTVAITHYDIWHARIGESWNKDTLHAQVSFHSRQRAEIAKLEPPSGGSRCINASLQLRESMRLFPIRSLQGTRVADGNVGTPYWENCVIW